MCGVMKIIPPPVSDNSTSGNETEASGDESVEEGTGNRKKRQADGTENEPDASADESNPSAEAMEEKTITILQDSECDESTKYV